MNAKLKSMLAHLSPIGWLLSLGLNFINRDAMTSFYLRQLLGLYLCFFITWFVPQYSVIAWGFIFVLWVYSFVGTVKKMENTVPLIGPLFQKWFKIIS